MARRGSRTGPPDFIGVGAQRSGTTWWFRTLLGHPQIRPPRGRRKELHFFDRFCATEMHDGDVAEYHARFRRRDGQIAGEWTPRYMGDIWTPRLLHRAAPDARLLVLLRDPIERYRSGVLHGLIKAPERRRDLLAADAVERGRYAKQIARLGQFFDRERILVLQYERCRADPAGEYRRTLRFLGVDDDHEPRGIDRARGTVTGSEDEELWPDVVRSFRSVLEPEVERLAALVPDLDLALWPHFAHLAGERGARG